MSQLLNRTGWNELAVQLTLELETRKNPVYDGLSSKDRTLTKATTLIPIASSAGAPLRPQICIFAIQLLSAVLELLRRAITIFSLKQDRSGQQTRPFAEKLWALRNCALAARWPQSPRLRIS
jgi:hypothetical protein